MKDSLSWARAIQVPRVSLTAESRAAGWPEAFTPENLVCLQYPWEGGTEEKKQARRNQTALSGVMTKAMDAGNLPTVEGTKTVVEYKDVPYFMVGGGRQSLSLGSSTWNARDAPPRMKKVKTGERVVSVRLIEARAFLAWLSECGEVPSEHIRAWFAARLAHDADTEEPHQDNAAAASEEPLAKPERPKVKQDYVKGVIDRVAAYCEERKIEFDRHSMPGKASDLLWVMGRLYPDQFKEMHSKTFQDHYKGVCSWPRCAAHQDGARSIYLEVFPEARAQVAGVVPIYK